MSRQEFYKTRAWKECSRGYMQSKNYVCERCGQPASICHHKKWLNNQNFTNPEIALNWDNLECLCMDCHNTEHFAKSKTIFDDQGNMIGCKESDEIKDYKRNKRFVDDLVSALCQKMAMPE